MSTGSNRRRHPRVRATGLGAHLRLPDGQRAPVLVENISLGGVFVRTDRLQPVDARLALDFARPGWKRMLSIDVRVATRLEPVAGAVAVAGMGLQFLGATGETQDRLAQLVRDLGPRGEPSPPPPVRPEPRATAPAGPQRAAPALPSDGLPFDTARLMTQVKGLLMELFEAQRKLAERTAELEAAREELRALRARDPKP